MSGDPSRNQRRVAKDMDTPDTDADRQTFGGLFFNTKNF